MAITFVATSTAASTSGVSSLDITIPGSVSVGDLLLLLVGQTSDNTFSGPTTGGWTFVDATYRSTSAGLGVFYKFAQAGDAGSTITATLSGGTAKMAATIRAYSGVNTTSTFDLTVTGGFASGSSATPTGAARSSTTANTEAVDVYVIRTPTTQMGVTWTDPSGFAHKAATNSTVSGNTNNVGMVSYDKALAAIGTNGAATATADFSNPWCACTILLRDAGGGGSITKIINERMPLSDLLSTFAVFTESADLSFLESPFTSGTVAEVVSEQWTFGDDAGLADGDIALTLHDGNPQPGAEGTFWADLEQFGWSHLTHDPEPFDVPLAVRVIQKHDSGDSWFVDDVSLYEDPIVWEFSNDDGKHFWPVFDIRNNPSGVFIFPDLPVTDTTGGTQLKYRVTGWRDDLHINGLAIRPIYGDLLSGIPHRELINSGGPLMAPEDHYHSIEQDPWFQTWHKPVPMEWYFFYRQWVRTTKQPKIVESVGTTPESGLVPEPYLRNALIYESPVHAVQLAETLVVP